MNDGRSMRRLNTVEDDEEDGSGEEDGEQGLHVSQGVGVYGDSNDRPARRRNRSQ